VLSSCDALADLLKSIEHFVNRLNVYTQISPTPTIDEIIVNLIVELISTLALVTGKLKRRRSREFFLADVPWVALLSTTQSNGQNIFLGSRTSEQPSKGWTDSCKKRPVLPQLRLSVLSTVS
jgi:hypothetical protein